MKTRFSEPAGSPGLREELASVDTAQLPPAEARRIEELVGNAGFFGLPTALGGDHGRRPLSAFESPSPTAHAVTPSSFQITSRPSWHP